MKKINYTSEAASSFKSSNNVELSGRLASDVKINEKGNFGTITLIHNFGILNAEERKALAEARKAGKPAPDFGKKAQALSTTIKLFADGENPIPADKLVKGALVNVKAFMTPARSWKGEDGEEHRSWVPDFTAKAITFYEKAEAVDDTETVDTETGEVTEA